MIVSLAAIFPDQGITLESVTGAAERRKPLAASPLDPPSSTQKAPFQPVPPGSYTSAAIILLTDGQRTTGPDPVEAARIAADRGVRIFTVGIGTPDGEIMGFEGWRMRVRLDEETLKTVANITHGQYFYAGNATDLKKVYQALNSRFVMEKKETEVTALFSALAALLAVTSALLSLAWFNRIL
jgi:Ca-activated chloride channel family protein